MSRSRVFNFYANDEWRRVVIAAFRAHTQDAMNGKFLTTKVR